MQIYTFYDDAQVRPLLVNAGFTSVDLLHARVARSADEHFAASTGTAAPTPRRWERASVLAFAVTAALAAWIAVPAPVATRVAQSRGHTHGRACRQLADQMLTSD